MTAFISGHLDLTREEFNEYYKNRILEYLDTHSFVVGDAKGCDSFAQELLSQFKQARVTVYHMFTIPRVNYGFPTRGGFVSDEDRDAAMTRDSDIDIAWVRPEELAKVLYSKKYKPGRVSGTQKNLNRRNIY